MGRTAAVSPRSSEPGRRERWLERLGVAGAAAVLSVLLQGVLIAIVPDVVRFFSAPERRNIDDWWMFWAIYAVTVGPIAETGLMAILLHVAMRIVPWWSAVVACALVMTLLHRIDGGTKWIVGPSFLLYGIVYVVRNRSSSADGFTVTALTHALDNALLFLVITAMSS